MGNANVRFMRVDTRMVHGQIITKWASAKQCRLIIIVDKNLDADPFMSNFYKKAAQKGVKIDVTSPEKATKNWDAGKFGPEGRNVMVVFKDVQNVYDLYKCGFKGWAEDGVDIGNQVAAHGKTQLDRDVFLSEEEMNMLEEVNNAGIPVYMQLIPEQASTDFAGMKKAFGK